MIFVGVIYKNFKQSEILHFLNLAYTLASTNIKLKNRGNLKENEIYSYSNQLSAFNERAKRSKSMSMAIYFDEVKANKMEQAQGFKNSIRPELLKRVEGRYVQSTHEDPEGVPYKYTIKDENFKALYKMVYDSIFEIETLRNENPLVFSKQAFERFSNEFVSVKFDKERYFTIPHTKIEELQAVAETKISAAYSLANNICLNLMGSIMIDGQPHLIGHIKTVSKKIGRVFTEFNALPKILRNVLVSSEIDIINSQHTFIINTLKTLNVDPKICPTIATYSVKKRTSLIENSGYPKALVKQTVISVQNGGNPLRSMKWLKKPSIQTAEAINGREELVEFLTSFRSEMAIVSPMMVQYFEEKFPEEFKESQLEVLEDANRIVKLNSLIPEAERPKNKRIMPYTLEDCTKIRNYKGKMIFRMYTKTFENPIRKLMIENCKGIIGKRNFIAQIHDAIVSDFHFDEVAVRVLESSVYKKLGFKVKFGLKNW